MNIKIMREEFFFELHHTRTTIYTTNNGYIISRLILVHGSDTNGSFYLARTLHRNLTNEVLEADVCRQRPYVQTERG